MKGVADIIATILMLVITIGLAGTAYVYISGMLTGKTAKTISVFDATCTSGGTANIVIANDGTTDILATELGVYINGADGSADCNEETIAIASHETGVMICTGLGAGSNTILVTSPTNSAKITVQC